MYGDKLDPAAISVRQAALGDVAQLSSLFAALDEHHIRARPDLFKRLDGPTRDHETIRALVANPATQALFVAEERPSGNLVGFAHVLEKHWPESAVAPATRSADVDAMFLERAFRRRGVAKLLLGALERWARQRELSQLTLSVRAFNHEAIAAYEMMGFGYVAHRMARPIPD
jgi:GNAT superfamily N-acetyltransferase